MENKQILGLLGMVIGIIGVLIIGTYSSWLISLGVLLLVFGNNLEQRSNK